MVTAAVKGNAWQRKLNATAHISFRDAGRMTHTHAHAGKTK